MGSPGLPIVYANRDGLKWLILLRHVYLNLLARTSLTQGH